MTTRTTLLAALCALVVASGCGDDDGPPSSEQIPANGAGDIDGDTTAPAIDAPRVGPATTRPSQDKRGDALTCIADDHGIEAEPVGDKGIEIATDPDARIEFFQSSLEAEGEQFEGRAEGAQQIGAAIFFIGDLPEEDLVAIEDCLNEQ